MGQILPPESAPATEIVLRVRLSIRQFAGTIRIQADSAVPNRRIGTETPAHV